MKALKLIQGSDEWLAHRATHFNASDAPAMMGLSVHKTRGQLLHEMSTGILPDVDSATQQRFNKGHRFEALARPLAENIIGEELSPIVGVDGEYSASFDGITFDNTIIFEHKTLNAALSELMANDEFILPICYNIQMEQQLMVSGADKCLFMASKFDDNDLLIEEHHTWYLPDLELRQRIIDSWAQFDIDLKNYVPPVIVEKVEAETIQALPVPSVVVRGEITTSNLGEITPLFDKYLGSVKSELSTDQDFADAEANAKNCRETATRIKSLRANIIAQMVDVNAVDSALANYEEAFNKVGLRLEKAVKEQKESIKTNAVLKTRQDYFAHIQTLEAEIAPIRLNVAMPDFAKAISGVKSMASMHSRLNDALANAKIEADALARDIRVKFTWYKEHATGYEMLFADLQQLITKPMDDFQLLLRARIDAKQKDDNAKYQKIKADTELKVREKVAAEVNQMTGKVAHQLNSKQNINHIGDVINMVKIPPVFEIIQLLALRYNVNESVVIDWLSHLDFKKAA